MHRILKTLVFPFSVALLMASDQGWNAKPVEQWTLADFKQILVKSPWVVKVTPHQLPKENEAALRQAGKMGGGQGIGIEALSASTLTGVGQTPTHARRPSLTSPFEIRWESAAPVRAAELAAHEEDTPDVESGVYEIAVYDAPGVDLNAKTLPHDMKNNAFLKRDGKKDLRPSRVDLLPQANGLTTVVFVFPRTDEITLADKRITFQAVISRMSVANYFYTEQMQIDGKLEL